MTINKKGGKGYKKAKKNSFHAPNFETAKDGQQYAKIIKPLGDKRFIINLHNSTQKLTGRARGSLNGWHNMKSGDIVLVSGRDFRNSSDESFVQDVYDIIQFYLPEDIRRLKKMGEITDPTFDEVSASISYFQNMYDENDEDDEEDELPQQREYEMPPSYSDDEDVDIDNV